MIPLDDFLRLTARVLRRQLSRDPGQMAVVRADAADCLFVIAGPGTGKTTALALRVLKLILVDDIDPAAIVATTFTKKAAQELRSRILGWGDQLRRAALQLAPAATGDQLRRLDLNRVLTGTLDSLIEDVLTQFRTPGQHPPVVVDPVVAESRMLRALWTHGRHRNSDLEAYAHYLTNGAVRAGSRRLAGLCGDVRARFHNDQIDVPAYLAHVAQQHPGASVLGSVVADYDQELLNRLSLDFTALEQRFLIDLQAGLLDAFADQVRVVLVDEYQDTNLLQEYIYFELAKHALNNNGSIGVVGDDDQSLYRFRGATVELFVAYPQRTQARLGRLPQTIALRHNYRSTRNLVRFFSGFAALDPGYTPARVQGKPPLRPARPGQPQNYPVLGMFRPTIEELADDLISFVEDVFRGTGRSIPMTSGNHSVVRDPARGAVGDCALLCSSPAEYSGANRPRLPLLMREGLRTLNQPIAVFNPRGHTFAEIPQVAQLGGLLLECIDPNGAILGGIRSYPREVIDRISRWRAAALDFIATNPPGPISGQGGGGAGNTSLAAFVDSWRHRLPQRTGTAWPREIPLLQLLYDLVSWLPFLQDDPEGLVYLEVFTRTITMTAADASYEAQVMFDPAHEGRSITQLYWNVFAPIASGSIEVNEDLVEHLPADRFNILSIHQAKGLEFPLTIVDVGADFRTSHWTQAFRRFPRTPSPAHLMEEEFRPFSPLGAPQRTALDRAYDDLVRLYFVAFSRAQDVLLLVGLGEPSQGPKRIENIATGWRRDGHWPWDGNPQVTLI